MTTAQVHSSDTSGSVTASLGMILFLAAEVMFFLGLVSALTVIGPAHSALFHRSSAQLSKAGLGASIGCLIGMSAVALRRPWPIPLRWAAVGLGVIFLGLQGLQYSRLVRHETVVTRVDGRLRVLDGVITESGGNLTVSGTMADLPDQFDPHDLRLPAGGVTGVFTVGIKTPADRQSYGPGRSNFFSSYFVLTAVHAVHLIGGMIALIVVTLRRRPRIPAVVLYWQTMNGVGIVCLVVLWMF